MLTSSDPETAALGDLDTQTLASPCGGTIDVTTTWHVWLAYEELQAFYDYSQEEILRLVVQWREARGCDPSLAFELVVAHCYAGCRHDEEELQEADP